MNDCKYCYEKEVGTIYGKTIKSRDWKETTGYKDSVHWLLQPKPEIDYLELFILKGKSDEKAGLMIDCGKGARYIDISYCPFCGRKLIMENNEDD